MKKHAICTISILLGTLSISQLLHAQSITLVRGNIPLEFEVQGKKLTAGIYEVAKVGSDLFAVHAPDGEIETLFTASSCPRATQKLESATLVFHRYGNQAFLSEIWRPADTVGIKIVETAEESRLKKAHSERQTLAVLLKHRLKACVETKAEAATDMVAASIPVANLPLHELCLDLRRVFLVCNC